MLIRLVVLVLGVRNARLLQRILYRSLRGIMGGRLHSGLPVSSVHLFWESDSHIFFGYYDTSPFSSDGKSVLASHTPLCNVSPTPHDQLTVGHYRLEDGDHAFAELGRTTTWCWQQGCRLQWYPSRNSEQVLYNKMVDGQYGCVIQNIHTRETVREYTRPLYCVSTDGRWGLSLDFSRLYRLRPGYGYTTLPDLTVGESVPQNSGIWRVDMNTGQEVLLFSIKDMATLAPNPSMQEGEHYFNHLCFNPEGSRFMFFHLCERRGKRSNRLLTSGLDGRDIHVLENERTVSHYAWKTDSELLVTTYHHDTGVQYLLYNDDSGTNHLVGQEVLTEDGHPSYFPDHNYILTDTYPDKAGEYHILVYDNTSNKLWRHSSFYSPVAFGGEVRCDLHPRLNRDGTMVCADIVHRSRRAVGVFRLAPLV